MTVIEKAAPAAKDKPSVINLLALVPVGSTLSCEDIAKRSRATVTSVRTMVQSCNSEAPSSIRFYKLGMGFEFTRGEDAVRRVK